MSRPTTTCADRRLVLLGPRNDAGGVAPALRALDVKGPVALVTAGWEEREEEDEELRTEIGLPSLNLRLHRRAEQVRRRDREVHEHSRRRRDQLLELQELYRLRLDALVRVTRELMHRDGVPDLLEPEIESAIELVRHLDRHHLERTRALEIESYASLNYRSRPEVARQREELAGILCRAEALVVAGGHVGILLEGLRLFDIIPALGDKPIVAWSAGAMALAQRVVLFHDSPPQGAGNAEVLGAGLGCYSGLVPFPHAQKRLRLDDPIRVSLLARRFAPDVCVALDEGAQLATDGGTWKAGRQTRRLAVEGRVLEMES